MPAETQPQATLEKPYEPGMPMERQTESGIVLPGHADHAVNVNMSNFGNSSSSVGNVTASPRIENIGNGNGLGNGNGNNITVGGGSGEVAPASAPRQIEVVEPEPEPEPVPTPVEAPPVEPEPVPEPAPVEPVTEPEPAEPEPAAPAEPAPAETPPAEPEPVAEPVTGPVVEPVVEPEPVPTPAPVEPDPTAPATGETPPTAPERIMSDAERETRELINMISPEDWYAIRDEFETRLNAANEALGIGRVGDITELERNAMDTNSRVLLNNIFDHYAETSGRQAEFSPEQKEQVLGILRNYRGAFEILVNSVHNTPGEPVEPGETPPADDEPPLVTDPLEDEPDIDVPDEDTNNAQPGRWRRAWDRLRTGYIAGTYKYVTGENITAEEQGDRRRSRLLKRALGAAALVGGALGLYYVATRGGGHNGSPDGGSGTIVIPGGGGGAHHGAVEAAAGAGSQGADHAKSVNLDGINPNTIHANTPDEFQNGVLNLLEKQGVHAHGWNDTVQKSMNTWMQTHSIASGMKDTADGTVQNAVNFPGGGGEFANATASAEQGFTIGPSGSGVEGLDAWVRHAESLGVTFNRTT